MDKPSRAFQELMNTPIEPRSLMDVKIPIAIPVNPDRLRRLEELATLVIRMELPKLIPSDLDNGAIADDLHRIDKAAKACFPAAGVKGGE